MEALLDRVAQKLSGKSGGAPKTIQFDLGDAGIYRLVIDAEGRCSVEPGEGEAKATLRMKAGTARKFLTGKLNPMVAMTTGQIKAEGDLRVLMSLQDLR
jgi:putative sterol carrier protein